MNRFSTDPSVRRATIFSTRAVALLVSGIAFALYLATMNRTFGFVDKGEMAAAAATFGLPHPTGYPTLVALGYLWTAIVPMREVLALNILAALLTAIGAGLMTPLFVELASRIGRAPREAKSDSALRSMTPVHAGLAALFTALCLTWWEQGTGFEAYCLFVAFLPAVVLLFLRYVDQESAREIGQPALGPQGAAVASIGFTRRGTLFALTLGLAFTSHLMPVLLAPGFLVYYFLTLGINGRAFLRWAYLAPAFAAGLLPYLLLVVISATEPVVSMGKVDSLGRLFDYISGAQFQGWMFSGWKIFKSQTVFFFGNLPSETGYIGLPLALVGLVHLLRRNLAIGLMTILMFITTILYAGQFAIKEIDPFYLIAIFTLGIWALAAVVWMGERFGGASAMALGVSLALTVGALNYSSADESRNTVVEDFARNMLGAFPRNALVFSTRWDFWVSGSYYLQTVENLRPDVIVINPNLLRSPAYIDWIAERYPTLLQGSERQIGKFLRASEIARGKGIRELGADTLYRIAYVNMVNAIIGANWKNRPALVTGEVDPAIGKGLIRVPYYLAYLLRADSTYQPQRFVRYDNFRFWEGRVDVDAMNIYEHYTLSQLQRGDYEARHGRDSLARAYVRYGLEFDPQFDERDVPPLPLGNDAQVKRVIRSYRQIRSQVERE